MSYIYFNLLKTVIAIVLVFIVDLIIERIALKKISSQKRSKKTRVIVRNVLMLGLIIFLAKIWIDGFGHFLAFVGFISAALTIAQKENILNLTGGFVIMWRDAFSEGDYVSIKDNEGVVSNLGIFYFSLEEVKDGDLENKTGKTIKVPNSYISQYPFAIYTFENFVDLKKKYIFKFNSDINRIMQFAKELETKLREQFAAMVVNFKGEVLKEYNKLKAKNRLEEIKAKIIIQQQKNYGFCLVITGHAPYKNLNETTKLIESEIISFSKEDGINLEDNKVN